MIKLDDLEEIKLLALDYLVAEKKKVERTYNKIVWLKFFKVGYLIWKVILPIGHKDHYLRKWSPNREGPYIVSKLLPGGVYHVGNKDGKMHERSINGKYIKTYKPYTWDAIHD